MKTIQRISVSLFFILGFIAISYGQKIVLTQSNESGIYKKGENIQVSVFLKDLKPETMTVKIRKNYSDKTETKSIEFKGNKVVLLNESFNEPTALIFQVSIQGETGSIGLVVDPYNFKPGTVRPKDFDSYWEKEKSALHALPVEVKSVPVNNIEKGYTCSDMEINCTGPKPARGYFAKPVDAKLKSLPIVLYVHAAGVKGDWCLSQPGNAIRFAKMGKGALCFDLNAHGMLNGQPQSYYDDLDNGELKNYNRSGIGSRNEYYFRGMYLRLMRTLDFLASQPEWDGKRIIVIGESQGGGQALAAAGLDKRVTAVVATVPAMCDWGGTLIGRQGGWPNPFNSGIDKEKLLESLPYFDTAHLLKDSKATIVTEIGFIDVTCPSTSVYAAINMAKGKKIVFGVPYRGHHVDQKQYQLTWEETVNKPKTAFITDFLK